MSFLLPILFWTPHFTETYFCGSTESKLLAESYFRENGQNPQNPRNFIYGKIYLSKVIVFAEILYTFPSYQCLKKCVQDFFYFV